MKAMTKILNQNLAAPLLLLIILSMITIPLPPFILDILFTFNILLSLIIIMVCIYAKKPLDFSIFPTVILFATLLRLGLNVASTRVILIHGQNGPAAAGHVIESFGRFVVGNNYAVGLVVFSILVIINFIVITKGAERVSEVNARFTLDSLPGKQMAIDADLNSGCITQEEAAERRKEIAIESEFHGSMDGASKFIKGDAIAGIAILLVNLIGGFCIGIIQHGLSVSQALSYYISFSIGDGLAAQIPSLILSTATAIIITRVSHTENLMSMVVSQIFSNARVLWIASAIMTFIGMVPGMPNVIFLTLGILCGAGAYLLQKNNKKTADENQSNSKPKSETKSTEITFNDIKQPKPLSIEIGYRLINLVNPPEKSNLITQIRGIRKELSQTLGFLVKNPFISDNIDLKPNQYSIKIRGTKVAEAEIMADLFLALGSSDKQKNFFGIPTKDPTFGLDALWIKGDQKKEAEALGYSVVDSSTVVATHLRQTLLENSDLLLSYNDVCLLIDEMKIKSPSLIDEFIPKHLDRSDIMRILRNLLAEQVPISDFTTICETLAEYASKELTIEQLTRRVRKALGNVISQNILGKNSTLDAFALDPELESVLQQGLSQPQFTIEPNLAKKLLNSFVKESKIQIANGKNPILLTSPSLRMQLSNFIRPHNKDLHVLAYDEIPAASNINIIKQITGTPASQEEATLV